MRAVCLLALVACSSSGPGLKRPNFPEARAGVWNSAISVVEGTDDEMMPGVSAEGWLVYASNRGANVDIYRRPVNGGSPERLTDHSGEDTDPVFSPDGERIAYASQAADVKGDIWVMDVDGDRKRQLTDRSTTDSAPCWAPSGNAIYFTSAPLGEPERIERLDLEYDLRTVIVKDAWDPAVSEDGQFLFYAALDERGRTRIFALRFSDGATAPATDGSYPEGLPAVDGANLLFVRFTDDENRDRRLDGADPASLWRVPVAPGIFDGREPPVATPLTTGTGSELFAATAGDWFAYTTTGAGDLEIYALPAAGIVSPDASATAILEAARAEDDGNLRRLGLRYLVAQAPELEGPARYELARDLGERGNYREAIGELQLAAQAFGDDPMAKVSEVEIDRLQMLELLNGEWWARDAQQRTYVEDTRNRLAALPQGSSPAVDARITGTLAEAKLALGDRETASALLEALGRAEQTPPEDRARALVQLALSYERLGDVATLSRLCETVLRRFATERHYARRCAERWVASAKRPVGVPEGQVQDNRNPLGVSVLSELQQISTGYADIPMLAARARAELANAQSAAGFSEASGSAWRRIVTDYPNQRDVLSRALVNLAESAERRGALDVAIQSYEEILARFPEVPALRAQASRGIARIALRRAQDEERLGNREAALANYRRLLETNRELAVAHRRYIYLSAELGRLDQVIGEYAQAATANPRDRFARYGYGYALTFESQPDLAAAEREVSAALEIDPRLAPAHLTLGWIRLQKERESPRNGWAEKAVNSFRVAVELIDPDTERRLYAAARLNEGNGLLELNKLDDAFLAYLDREQSGEPFDQPLTELLFRERFARVALREDNLDVALDQGLIAYELSQTLNGKPRSASLEALIGGIYFLSQSYGRALPWLDRSREHYRSTQDWDRAVPLTRTLSLAAKRAGQPNAARRYVEELQEMLAAGQIPSPPSRPLFVGFEFQFWTEVAAKADDVTLGPYGFDAEIERKLSTTLAARDAVAAGELETAKALLVERIELLRPVYETALTGVRAVPEWLVALNEAAVVHAKTGDWPQAVQWWTEGVSVAASANEWRAVVQMSESLLRAWLAAPEKYRRESATAAVLGLETALENGDPDDAQTAARVLALIDLHSLERARAELRESSGDDSASRFRGALAILDRAATAANRADRLAREHQMLDVDATLPERPYDFIDETEEETIAPSSPAENDTPADEEPLESDPAPDNAIEIAAESAAPALEEEGAGADDGPAQLVRASLNRTVRRWRRYFDASETTGDQMLLELAIEGYLKDPVPVDAPEHPRFLARAVEHFGDDIEKVWTLLEHERLLSLQPGLRRIDRGAMPKDWLRMRGLRGGEGYTPEKSRTLVRALEGIPVRLDTLRTVLGAGSALVQVHQVGERWFWFGVDAERLNRFEGDAGTQTAPAALLQWLEDRPLETVYLDGGELLADAASADLPEPIETLEVLSGTYLVASYDARNLARAEPIVITGPATPETLSSSASIVHFRLPGKLFGGRTRPGDAQLVLEGASAEDGAPFDLDAISEFGTTSQLALFDQVPADARAGRLLAQAALFGDVPSVVTFSGALGDTGNALDAALVTERLSTAVQGVLPTGARIFGYRGMTLEDRVVFAFEGLLAAARAALPVYKEAQRQNDRVLWTRAKGHYNALMGYIDYLLVPEHRELLANSSIKLGAAIAKTLPTRQLQFEQQLATTYFALEETSAAAEVREHLIEGYQAAGEQERALEEYLDLGKVQFQGNSKGKAKEAFTQCVTLAQELKKPVVEAECRSRLGSVYRSTYDYDRAVEYFESAVALYRAADHPDLADSLQFLGILYEGSLNDYDAALEQFEAALAAARRFEEKQTLVAKMLVSIARIYRLRGEYEPALDNVRRAREALTEGAEEQLTEILLETANIYWYRGNYRRARRAQSEALELSLRRADTFRRIQALGVGGLIALNQGELTEAENLIRAALELSRLVARPSEEAAQLNNLGVVLQRGGRLDEAIQSFRNALAIDEQLGSREGRAFDLRNLGTALGRKERYDEALAALDEALTLSRELGNRFNEIQSLFYRGEVLLALGRGAEAGAMFEESATLATQFAIPEVQWRSLYALGRLEEDRAQERSARQYYRDALQVSERLGRSSEAAGEVSTRDDLYEDAVRLAVKAEDLDEVFNLFDRRRARARLDAFANRTVTFAEPEAQEMLRAERRARDAVIAAERELSRDGDNAVAAVDSARQAQRMRYLELQARFPRIARAFTIAPVALGDVLDSLPSGSGAVSFLVGRRRSWALLLQPEGARVFELEVTRENLRPLLAEIEESMRAFAPIDQALTAASGLLFGPMADELSALSHLVVVSDSGLAAIPYAALPLGESRLVDALTLSEASSMSAIVDLLKVPAAKARTVSAFAYGSDLPYARLEARAVDPTPILGGAATADALRRDRSDAWDLAVHATLDPADPLASTLEMADGRLEAAEVFSFERVARLVTLSGCETARAARSGAQLSLAEAFITGGAQSVIATRHRVADFSAARAMKWFYRYLPSQSTAEALRQAMQTIREERPHPAHWATFSLVGDFR